MTNQQLWDAVASLPDHQILDALPPSWRADAPAAESSAKERGESGISRFLSSGWVAAVLSVVVATAVIVAIVWAGQTTPVTPPVGGTGPDTAPGVEETPDDTTETESLPAVDDPDPVSPPAENARLTTTVTCTASAGNSAATHQKEVVVRTYQSPDGIYVTMHDAVTEEAYFQLFFPGHSTVFYTPAGEWAVLQYSVERSDGFSLLTFRGGTIQPTGSYTAVDSTDEPMWILAAPAHSFTAERASMVARHTATYIRARDEIDQTMKGWSEILVAATTDPFFEPYAPGTSANLTMEIMEGVWETRAIGKLWDLYMTETETPAETRPNQSADTTPEDEIVPDPADVPYLPLVIQPDGLGLQSYQGEHPLRNGYLVSAVFRHKESGERYDQLTLTMNDHEYSQYNAYLDNSDILREQKEELMAHPIFLDPLNANNEEFQNMILDLVLPAGDEQRYAYPMVTLVDYEFQEGAEDRYTPLFTDTMDLDNLATYLHGFGYKYTAFFAYLEVTERYEQDGYDVTCVYRYPFFFVTSEDPRDEAHSDAINRLRTEAGTFMLDMSVFQRVETFSADHTLIGVDVKQEPAEFLASCRQALPYHVLTVTTGETIVYETSFDGNTLDAVMIYDTDGTLVREVDSLQALGELPVGEYDILLMIRRPIPTEGVMGDFIRACAFRLSVTQ